MAEAYALRSVAALLRHASMSASYKPALLKALVRLSRRSNALSLDLRSIGEEFARMYWNQTIIYHLRQNSTISKEAEVIKAIRHVAQRFNARQYSQLPEYGRDEIRRRMARVLTIDVLRRFHASKPREMDPIYDWDPARGTVELTSASHAFMTQQAAPLEVLANYSWAKFLEKTNMLAPRIIQKVEADGPPRTSLAKFLRILLDEETDPRCFYCDRLLGAGVAKAVDHVIPRSFVMDDHLWDMVLTCRTCNCSKSDLLPAPEFIERLVLRNAVRMKSIAGSNVGLFVGADDVTHLYDAAISVEWPGFWAPG